MKKMLLIVCFMLVLTVSVAAMPADELIADIYAADSETKAEIQDCLDEYAEQIALMARSCNPDAPPDIEVTLAALKSDNAMRYYYIHSDFSDAVDGSLEQLIDPDYIWYIPIYEAKIDVLCSINSETGEWDEPSVSTGKFDVGYGCMGYEHAAELLAQQGITDIDDMKFIRSLSYLCEFMYVKASGTEYMIFLSDVSLLGLDKQKVYDAKKACKILNKTQMPLGNANFETDEYLENNKGYSSTDVWAMVFIVSTALAVCVGGGCLIYFIKTKK